MFVDGKFWRLIRKIPHRAFASKQISKRKHLKEGDEIYESGEHSKEIKFENFKIFSSIYKLMWFFILFLFFWCPTLEAPPTAM